MRKLAIIVAGIAALTSASPAVMPDALAVEPARAYVVLTGDADDDYIIGTREADLIRGRGGADFLEGRRAADIVKGGVGDDYVGGGRGRDKLVGGGGYDVCFGDGGADTFVDCEFLPDYHPRRDVGAGGVLP